MKYALLSVSDKTNITTLAHALVAQGVCILSSGGTYRTLQETGIAATDVADYTGVPEMMNGRVKTLHPKVHGGILARRLVDDQIAHEQSIHYIDLVVVNLYPFAEVIKNADASLAEAIENIDIGGPALIRSAAKNHAFVTVLTDPNDYQAFIDAYTQGAVTNTLRAQLAVKAFRHTATYDALIYKYLNTHYDALDELACDDFLLYGKKYEQLRYGENPSQSAQVYTTSASCNLPLGVQQIQGTSLSYNNWVDAQSAYHCVSAFTSPACVIVKHATPCGAALANDITTAYQKAFSADTSSAFGGIVALNAPLTSDLLTHILATQFVEIIIAHSIDNLTSVQAVAQTKPKLRILITNSQTVEQPTHLHTLADGFLVQQPLPNKLLAQSAVRHVAGPAFTGNFADCMLAWHIVTWVKSNAIVLIKDGMTIGIGGGQPSRIRSVEIALENAARAGFDTAGAMLASDAFFPFRDGIDNLAQHGIQAVLQPGGSIRDDEVQAAAAEHGISLLFTDQRVFRH